MGHFIRTCRIGAVAGLALALQAAAPPLTTIQDVLYKADGTRFNGLAVISWSSFEGPDTSNVSTHTITVQIVDGNLRVQLVPNTTAVPPAPYTVKYNSDGKAQFEETWAVPPSTRTLRVRDVRLASPAGSITPAPETSSPLQETDIVGLTADLAARPLKAAGYAPGRTAFVNAAGALESVAGDPADCVRVDGTAGPCGQTQPAFVDNEVPAGIIDGANLNFGLAAGPNPSSSLALYRNGMLLKAGQDYTLNGTSVTFLPAAAPQPGDTLLAAYRSSIASAIVSGGPEVLCSGTGTSTSSTTDAVLARCILSGATLQPGERVEVRFDYAHGGGSSGYVVRVMWGGTAMVERTASAADILVSGRGDAAILETGAQLSSQSWGSSLTPAYNVTEAPGQATELVFMGRLTKTSADTIALRSYTVLRFPKL